MINIRKLDEPAVLLKHANKWKFRLLKIINEKKLYYEHNNNPNK